MYQQITIVGNVGNSPEMRYTPSGHAITSLSIAVNRRWTDGNGEKQEKTTWFKVACWRKLAEVVSQYATKGQQVLVIGELEEPDVFTDKQGETRASLQITAREVKFLGNRTEPAQRAQPAQPEMESDATIPF